MEAFAYAAIKRSVNNDNDSHEADKFIIKLFVFKEQAVEWLLDQYEFWEDGEIGTDENRIETLQEWKESEDRKVFVDFLLKANNDDALFHWEWKRRGNHRTYKIIEIQNGQLDFYMKTKNLYKFKNMQIVKKKNT